MCPGYSVDMEGAVLLLRMFFYLFSLQMVCAHISFCVDLGGGQDIY